MQRCHSLIGSVLDFGRIRVSGNLVLEDEKWLGDFSNSRGPNITHNFGTPLSSAFVVEKCWLIALAVHR